MSSIKIKLFRFNPKEDNEPYYLNYEIELDPLNTIHDLLEEIEQYDSFEYAIETECFIRINNYFTSSLVLVNDVIDTCGYEWTIEPINTHTVINDLIVDSSDYFKKLHLFHDYLTDIQIQEYKFKYYLEYHASNSINKNINYIGDHNLLIAYDLIHSTFDIEIQKQIITILKNEDNGIYYHTSLENRLLLDENNATSKIDELLKICKLKKNDIKNSTIIFDNSIKDFSNFNIGFYNNSDKGININRLGANIIESFHFKNSVPLYCKEIDENFVYSIAGEILLHAKDLGCDFFIVHNKEELEIFDTQQNKIEETLSCEINLPILTRNQFAMIVNKERSRDILGTHKHNIHIPFVDYYLFS